MLARCSALVVLLLVACGLSANAQVESQSIQELIVRAESGDTEAMFSLGTAYDWGRGVPADSEKALEWYRRAAERGHAEAQNSLGSGLQAAERFEEAMGWYARAAEQNHDLATHNLAYLYDLGLGTDQDRTKGYELYLKAANLGWAESMWNLAVIHGSGQLGEVDMYAACVWTMRAARHMNPLDSELERRVRGGAHTARRALTRRDFERCENDDWRPSEPRT